MEAVETVARVLASDNTKPHFAILTHDRGLSILAHPEVVNLIDITELVTAAAAALTLALCIQCIFLIFTDSLIWKNNDTYLMASLFVHAAILDFDIKVIIK